jgi:CTP synthase (UTP-ammonia lyase)
MKTLARIGVIGDPSPEVRAHVALPKVVDQAAERLGIRVDHHWFPTGVLAGKLMELDECDGLWCVPGSPYVNMEAALEAIRFARERRRPFLGTCGGFQHALIEFGRNVLGLADADHAESNPGSSRLLITPLSCSLVGRSGTIRLVPESRAHAIYGRSETAEEYHCNYGLNSKYRSRLEEAGLRTSGVDEEGAVRIVELPEYPFYLATLFQPELSSTPDNPHPIIVAFVQAAALASPARASSPSHPLTLEQQAVRSPEKSSASK